MYSEGNKYELIINYSFVGEVHMALPRGVFKVIISGACFMFVML